MKGRVCSREDTLIDIHTSVNRSIFLYVRTYVRTYYVVYRKRALGAFTQLP